MKQNRERKLDDAKAIETAELQLDHLIEVMHKDLNYWQILRLFLNASIVLQMRADVEYWVRLRN